MMLKKRDHITCPGRGREWRHYVFGDPMVREHYRNLASKNNQWAITANPDEHQNWHGAMLTFVDQQEGRHSSQRPGARRYNVLAFHTAMARSIHDRPDQTGPFEQAQKSKNNSVIMNKMLIRIEQGNEVLQSDEYKIRVTQEPKRVFPLSDKFEKTIDSNFHIKNEDLPLLVCEQTSEQHSHFDPRHTREERAVNTDVMTRQSHLSTAARSALLALEHILQTTSYENSQRRGSPSNLSHDLLMIKG